jgi:hypothetical protein
MQLIEQFGCGGPGGVAPDDEPAEAVPHPSPGLQAAPWLHGSGVGHNVEHT